MCERNKLSIISLTSECLLAIFFLHRCINYNKKSYLLDWFFFCDIQNNQSLKKSYQPMLKAEADNSYLDLDYSGLIEEVIVNNFMKFYKNCLKKNN